MTHDEIRNAVANGRGVIEIAEEILNDFQMHYFLEAVGDAEPDIDTYWSGLKQDEIVPQIIEREKARAEILVWLIGERGETR